MIVTVEQTPDLPADAEQVNGTKPLYRIVEDPRERRRQLRVQQQHQEDVDLAQQTTFARTTPSPIASPTTIDRRLELPVSDTDERVITLNMVDGAKLTDYAWIGMYDRCTKVCREGCLDETSDCLYRRELRTSHSKVSDRPMSRRLRPSLDGIIMSARMRCDYSTAIRYSCRDLYSRAAMRRTPVGDGWDNTHHSFIETHFYVGVGDFPHYIVKQIRAIVVGESP